MIAQIIISRVCLGSSALEFSTSKVMRKTKKDIAAYLSVILKEGETTNAAQDTGHHCLLSQHDRDRQRTRITPEGCTQITPFVES